MNLKLSEFASVQMGTIIKRIQVTEEKIEDADCYEMKGVLMPKNIDNGLILHSNAEKEEICILSGEKKAKYTTQGDVVIKLTSPYDVAYVTEDASGLIVPSYCALVADIRTDIADARYVAGFLNTAYVRTILQAGLNETYGMVKVKDIGNLIIPLPALEEQQALGKAYELIVQKRKTLRDLLDVEAEIADNLISKAAMEVLRFDV